MKDIGGHLVIIIIVYLWILIHISGGDKLLAMVLWAGEAVQNGCGEMWQEITASDTKLRIKLSEEFLNPNPVNWKYVLLPK